MSERKYDPAFEEILPLLPTVTDFSDVTAFPEMREARYDMFEPPAPRDDAARRGCVQ